MSIGQFDSENITRHTTLALWITFGITAGLGVWGFVCPPKGVIDGSVIKFSMILFGIAALAVAREAIKEGLGVKLSHGDTVLEITDNDNNNNE